MWWNRFALALLALEACLGEEIATTLEPEHGEAGPRGDGGGVGGNGGSAWSGAGGDSGMGGRDAAVARDAAVEVDARSPDAADRPDGSRSGYDPCPPAGMPCQIMPLGDSITAGLFSMDGGGYRTPLFRMTLKAGQRITFVGTASSGPISVDGVPFPRQNEGHGGNVIDQISALVTNALTGHQPQIVTLMIGTNDINLHLDLPNAPARLGGLLDKITTTAPNALLVVALVIPSQSGNPDITQFNADARTQITDRITAGQHVVLVDMFGAFSANPQYAKAWMYDNLHPNDAGYAVMADVWYRAIGAFLR